jgi:hypothetical protein
MNGGNVIQGMHPMIYETADTLRRVADDVDVLVSELEAAQKERDELEAAHNAARMALQNAQTEATHGKTASVAFIDQCVDSAVRALDAVAATPTPTKENE